MTDPTDRDRKVRFRDLPYLVRVALLIPLVPITIVFTWFWTGH